MSEIFGTVANRGGYVGLEVKLTGVIADAADVQAAVEKALREGLDAPEFSGDIDVEIFEHAGVTCRSHLACQANQADRTSVR